MISMTQGLAVQSQLSISTDLIFPGYIHYVGTADLHTSETSEKVNVLGLMFLDKEKWSTLSHPKEKIIEKHQLIYFKRDEQENKITEIGFYVSIYNKIEHWDPVKILLQENSLISKNLKIIAMNDSFYEGIVNTFI